MFSTVSLESFENIVSWFKNLSPGPDEIPISFIKKFFSLLGRAMLQICKKSLEKGTFLDPLKIMSPIFKAQDRKK